MVNERPMQTSMLTFLRNAVCRITRGVEILLALLIVVSTTYLILWSLSIRYLGLQSGPGDDVFAATLGTLGLFGAFLLALGVLVRRMAGRLRSGSRTEGPDTDSNRATSLTDVLEVALALVVTSLPVFLLTWDVIQSGLGIHIGLAALLPFWFGGFLLAVGVLARHVTARVGYP